MTNHSDFKGFKGYDSYSTFQISSLPGLEEHVVWALVTLLTFFPNMPLPLQLISQLWQNSVLFEDRVKTGRVLSYFHLKEKNLVSPWCLYLLALVSQYTCSAKRDWCGP